ncbi:MAG: HAD-IA family hydrolase [Chromatiales bacterium]|nr:HAD-IA family hydrolase [Chromatiales bacterium]
MEFDLLIFDWDGTLMDSERKIVACFRAACDQVGVPRLPDAHYRSIIGLGLTEAIAALFPEADSETLARIGEGYRHAWLNADQTPQTLFPGARETLDWGAEQGFVLAVATGKSRRGLDRALGESGLHARFAATRCADETRSKPAPDMVLELCTELAIAPERALVIGDTDFDLAMANAAGAAAIGVLSGAHERERLAAQKPIILLNHVAELPGWFADNAAVPGGLARTRASGT